MKKQLPQTTSTFPRLSAIGLLTVVTLLFGATNHLAAQTLYYSDILTILDSYNCTGCHGTSGGLNVNSYAGLLSGGNQCGPAIVPFNANGSPIVTKIDPAIPNCAGSSMPPSGGPVSATHLAAIKLWISGGALQSASSPCADLSISAYVEGSAFNKCIEIYNGTGAAKDMTSYALQVYSNGSPTVSSNIALSGTLAAGAYYLVCHTDANLPGLTPNLLNSNLNFNGNDAVALNNGSLNIDVVGQIGTDPGIDGWLTTTGCGTKNLTMVKNNNGGDCPFGNFLGDLDFLSAIDSYYTCYPEDDVTMLGSYVPPVGGCPTLAYPTGVTQNITLCSGDNTPLAVVPNGSYSQIIWEESGIIVGTGPSIPGQFQNNGCTPIVFNITVSALSSDSLCAFAYLNYTLTVQPNPAGTAALTYPDPCSVCIENGCAGATYLYITSTGVSGTGNCYQAEPGENVTVTFTVSNDCGAATLQSTLLQCTPPQSGTVEGAVWFDSNSNGQYDMGTDLLLNNIGVSLVNADTGQTIQETTTDFTGQYSFDNVPLGNYYLVFAPAGNNSPTIGTDEDGQTPNFSIAGGQTITQDIGYTQIISVAPISSNTTSDLRFRNMSPNPTRAGVTLLFDNLSTSPLLLQVSDIAGRVVFQCPLFAVGHNLSYSFETANFAEGLYIVSLRNGQMFAQQKLQVIR